MTVAEQHSDNHRRLLLSQARVLVEIEETAVEKGPSLEAELFEYPADLSIGTVQSLGNFHLRQTLRIPFPKHFDHCFLRSKAMYLVEFPFTKPNSPHTNQVSTRLDPEEFKEIAYGEIS